MSYLVKTIKPFDRQAKHLLKRYSSLGRELAQLVSLLSHEPNAGISLGRNCYKIRLSIASKGKGKSGGARVITCVVAVDEEVYLLAIYDKSEQDAISDTELRTLIEEVPAR